MNPIIKKAVENTNIKKKQRENACLIHAFFNQTAIGVAHLNVNGTFVHFNKKFCDILSLNENYIKSTTLYDLIAEEDKINNDTPITKLLENGIDSLTYKIDFLKNSSHRVNCKLTLSLVKDDKNQPLYIIAFLQNMEKWKKIKNELNEYKEKLEEMVTSKTAAFEKANIELKNHYAELEKFTKTMVGREMRIVELKNQVNELSKELGREYPYPPIWDEQE